jgi:glycosyltransferase involved in cell wall biosynthesis
VTEQGGARRTPRVIHIVESLDIGAVESWLLRMLEAGRTFGEPLNWTFYSVLTKPGRFDDRARALGATVINSPVELDDKVAFVRNLRAVLREGKYDVLHCHHDVVSAVYLVASSSLGIPRRIVHVHNADLHVPTGSELKSALLREPMRQLCMRIADRIVGISRYTLDNFLRGSAPRAGRDVVLYYGIATDPYHGAPPDEHAMRASLSLPVDARVLLFAGRMVSYKNPLFVLDVMAAIAEAEPNVYAVFAGAGPLEEELRARARELGLSERVRILGWRDDTVALMRFADLFIFPRVEEVTPDVGREGLGLVVVEAQAAGLMSLLSRAIPDDAIVVSELCETRALAGGAAGWGSSVREMLARPRADRAAALAAIERSPFSLEAGFRNLVALHDGVSAT